MEYLGLLKENGVHHEPGRVPPTDKEDGAGAADSKVGKPKLSEKIKAKLHIGKDRD